MEIYKKLLQARDLIKKSKVEKEGLNKFSGYKYFSPSQISILVHDAMMQVGLIHIYQMIRDENGMTANLEIINIEKSEERILFTIPTSIPDIKATNEAQKLGGAITYSERYLLMIAFDIVDNSLDFDTTENTEKLAKKEKTEQIKTDLKAGIIEEITEKFKFEKWNGEFLPDKKINYAGKIYTCSDKALGQLNDFVEMQSDKMFREQQNQSDLDFLDNMRKF